MSQCHVIKQMVNAIAYTIELRMHLEGLLSTQEARVALGYRLNSSSFYSVNICMMATVFSVTTVRCYP